MAKSGTGRSGVIPSGRILPGLGTPGRRSGVPDELPHSDLEAFLARGAGAKREVRSPPRPFGTSPAQEREAQRLAADGVRLMERGRHVEAVAVLQRSLSLNPAVAEVQRHLGAALIAAGRPGQAVGPLTNAIRLDPSFAMAHVSLGFALKRLDSLRRRSPGIGTRSTGAESLRGSPRAWRTLSSMRFSRRGGCGLSRRGGGCPKRGRRSKR